MAKELTKEEQEKLIDRQEEMYDRFYKRTGSNEVAAAMMVVAWKLGGLEHWLRQLCEGDGGGVSKP